jgi:hypothetical protein
MPLLGYFINFVYYSAYMPDFTINTFHKLLATIKNHRYTFQTFAGFLKEPAERAIILRHDVDARKMNSLKTAQLENELGITGTYYFRMVPQSFDEEVIKQIAGLGHEIGYHYEDVSRCVALNARCGVRGTGCGARFKRLQDCKTARPQDKENYENIIVDSAIESFKENLEKLRRVVPVETICMHGSPLSKYDNRMLWEKYDYRDFGIIGEPYLDVDFNDVLYLTDTGRRWDGEAVSVRDKATGTHLCSLSFGGQAGRRASGDGGTKRRRDLETESEDNPAPRTPYPAPVFHFHSTFDIIKAAKEKKLPDKIMITVHPQRWDGRPLPWVKELVWQNIKNIGKRIVTHKERLKD